MTGLSHYDSSLCSCYSSIFDAYGARDIMKTKEIPALLACWKKQIIRYHTKKGGRMAELLK